MISRVVGYISVVNVIILFFQFLVIEEDRSCMVSVSSNPLHIMCSSSPSELSCGTKSQPWRLEAPAGQQINVSLIDFGVTSRDSADLQAHGQSTCLKYGRITEKLHQTNLSFCDSSNGQKFFTYKSLSNVIEIVQTEEQSSVSHGYLLRITGSCIIMYATRVAAFLSPLNKLCTTSRCIWDDVHILWYCFIVSDFYIELFDKMCEVIW